MSSAIYLLSKGVQSTSKIVLQSTVAPPYDQPLTVYTVVNNQLSGAREVQIDLIDYSFRPSNYRHRLNPYLIGLDTYLEVKD
jgi:hypothetical protein